MASIIKERVIEVEPEHAWSALCDFGALHQRLVPGFVTECKVEGDTRVITFFNGQTARERLISSDDRTRRLCYAVVGGPFTHHNASAQVFAEGGQRTRFVWIADLLPDELAGAIEAMMERGADVIKQTLEGGSVAAR